MKFDRVLCDLKAIISRVPLSVCKRLGIGKMKPTYVSLQLTYRSIKYPICVLEDVLVKVRHLYIPTDCIIMDVEEDYQILIIDRRPFLRIASEIIDVKKGRLAIEVVNESI